MGKLALWILVAVAVVLLLRMLGSGKRGKVASRQAGKGNPGSATGRRDGAQDSEASGAGGELVMGCAVCGVHVPASEAVFARGKVYCGATHRDQDE